MKSTQKTIALVRLILGEIDMWERQLQQIDGERAALGDDAVDETFQIDRAERMADMLASAFDVVTGAHGELLHNQQAQHVCDQALKASQDALKYATPLTWTLSAHKR
tara:strand:+ start:368 stop:688 length:321 start_codon:yes stop_codon:yes gene_type:complete